MRNTWLTNLVSRVSHLAEALLEEAQEDITPEVGSEVILVEEAGAKHRGFLGQPPRLSLSPSQIRFVFSYSLVWRSCERKTRLQIEINRLLANSVK